RITHRVRTVIFVLPNNLAIFLIQTKDSFLAVNYSAGKRISRIIRAFSKLPIGHVDAPLRNRRPGISCANRRSPKNWRSIRRKFLPDARSPQNTIPFRPKQLRQIIRKKRARVSETCNQEGNERAEVKAAEDSRTPRR